MADFHQQSCTFGFQQLGQYRQLFATQVQTLYGSLIHGSSPFVRVRR